MSTKLFFVLLFILLWGNEVILGLICCSNLLKFLYNLSYFVFKLYISLLFYSILSSYYNIRDFFVFNSVFNSQISLSQSFFKFYYNFYISLCLFESILFWIYSLFINDIFISFILVSSIANNLASLYILFKFISECSNLFILLLFSSILLSNLTFKLLYSLDNNNYLFCDKF